MIRFQCQLSAGGQEPFFFDFFLNGRKYIVYCHIHAAGTCARHQFHLAGRGLFTNIDAVRNAHEIGVFEFDARALVSVIQQNVKSRRFKFLGNLLAGFAQSLVGHVGHRDNHGKRRNCNRQPETVGVVRLLDRCCEDALDTDAVAAHDRRNFFAVGVEHARTH